MWYTVQYIQLICANQNAILLNTYKIYNKQNRTFQYTVLLNNSTTKMLVM